MISLISRRKTLRHLNTMTSIGEAVKTFQTEFWKFYHSGSFFQKKMRKVAQKIAGLAISGRHNSAMITNDENWRPNSPSTGCLVFTFTIRINSKSFSWAVRCAQENISIEYFPWFAWIHSRRIIILHAAAAFGLVLVVIQYHKIVWVRLAQKDRFVIDVSPLCLHSQIHLPPTVTLADSYTASDEQYSL